MTQGNEEYVSSRVSHCPPSAILYPAALFRNSQDFSIPGEKNPSHSLTLFIFGHTWTSPPLVHLNKHLKGVCPHVPGLLPLDFAHIIFPLRSNFAEAYPDLVIP